MALKVLMLRRKLSDAQSALAELRTQQDALTAREAELEAAIGEASTEEEIAEVERSIAEYETQRDALGEQIASIEGDIGKLEGEIQDEEEKQTPPAPAVEPSPEPTPAPVELPQQAEPIGRSRKDDCIMEKRYFGMTFEQRTAFAMREDVKTFLDRVRGVATEMQSRAVTNADIFVPEVMLDLIRQDIGQFSKLIGKVRRRVVRGTARQPICGAYPEGVWTEMIAKVNELALSFNAIEVDGYKVGGYIPIANSLLADSDLNLAMEIMTALSRAIGKALDKAIIFGTGTKMPVGFVTRLKQETQPPEWGAKAPTWTDLHTTNILTLDLAASKGAAFFASLIQSLGVAKSKDIGTTRTWIMNEKTHALIMAKALEVNAAGAYVAGINGTMPIIGGEIVEMDCMADNDIAGGFLDAYLLVEREGVQLAQSEHVRFLDDQTVFKGTARYDGDPVLGECFVIANIANAAPTTTTNFPADAAN